MLKTSFERVSELYRLANLAGALGRPTRVLLPSTPDWGRLLDRDDSPWYPTARLFRQTRPGDWNWVLLRVRAALAAADRRIPDADG